MHITVLLNEAVESLNLNPNGIYLDCTFGNGGHSKLILSKLGPYGKLFAVDCDASSIMIARKINDPRFFVIHCLFSDIKKYMKKMNLIGKINGIIADLGMSSSVLNNPERGFSFIHDGPLDMRMDTSKKETAMTWLAKSKRKEIELVLKNFGEERFARKIAMAIVKNNNKKLITRTSELSKLITNIIPYRKNKKHPATKSFQAIRIYVNNELEEIKKLLLSTLSMLSIKGILSVISFHSLEDRLVKCFIKKYSQRLQIPKGLPITESQIKLFYKNEKKLKFLGKIKPSKEEIMSNFRSRSAIMRSVKRIR